MKKSFKSDKVDKNWGGREREKGIKGKTSERKIDEGWGKNDTLLLLLLSFTLARVNFGNYFKVRVLCVRKCEGNARRKIFLFFLFFNSSGKFCVRS